MLRHILKFLGSAFPQKFQSNKKPLKIYNEEIIGFLEMHFDTRQAITVVDVGAHLGTFSLSCIKSFPESTVHAIEPYSQAFAELNKNVEDKRNIKTYNFAVSNYSGSDYLHVNAFEQTNSLLESNITFSIIDRQIQTNRKDKVEVTTIDAWCATEQISKIDILKIDVQGVSFEVLKGAFVSLVSGNIKVIIVETEFIEIYKEEKLYHHIASYLEECDFQLYSIFNLHFDINKRLSWGDAVFIKKK